MEHQLFVLDTFASLMPEVDHDHHDYVYDHHDVDDDDHDSYDYDNDGDDHDDLNDHNTEDTMMTMMMNKF